MLAVNVFRSRTRDGPFPPRFELTSSFVSVRLFGGSVWCCGYRAENRHASSRPGFQISRRTKVEVRVSLGPPPRHKEQRLPARIRGWIRKSSRFRGVLAVEVFRFRTRDASVQGRFERVGALVSVGHFGGSVWAPGSRSNLAMRTGAGTQKLREASANTSQFSRNRVDGRR